jgi:hypothetical protein
MKALPNLRKKVAKQEIESAICPTKYLMANLFNYPSLPLPLAFFDEWSDNLTL